MLSGWLVDWSGMKLTVDDGARWLQQRIDMQETTIHDADSITTRLQQLYGADCRAADKEELL